MIPGWTQGDLGAQSGCLGSEHVAKQDGLNCSIISHEMSQRRPVAAAALVLVLILGPLTAGPLNAAPATPMCQTQGLPKGAAPPAPPSATGGLAFCTGYNGCSCCDHEASAVIFNSLKAVLLDAEFSERCKQYLSKLACRVCDPLVGIGERPALCRNFCNGWHRACRQEYFAFHPTSGNLVPCPRSSQQALLCAKMGDLAPNGTALCTVEGRAVSDDLTRCYNGLDHPMLDSCRLLPQPRRSPRSSPPPAKKRAANKGGSNKRKNIAKPRKKKAGGARYSTADLVLLSLAVGGVAYLWWQFRGNGDTGWDQRFPGTARTLGGDPATTRTAKHK